MALEQDQAAFVVVPGTGSVTPVSIRAASTVIRRLAACHSSSWSNGTAPITRRIEASFREDADPGDRLLHCHMLAHAAGGMMTWRRVA